MLTAALNLAILFGSPLLFVGLINRTKAWWAGRCGAPLVQPFRDVARLLRGAGGGRLCGARPGNRLRLRLVLSRGFTAAAP
jgi:hypothetical protein